jgi:hypothetical protein
MDIAFLKLRVCGSDLILVDASTEEGRARDWSLPALEMLDRRRGVGAQRLAVLSRAEESWWLAVHDSRGQRSPVLADAALCAVRWLLDSGRVGGDRVVLRHAWGESAVDVLDGSSLGLSLGPLLCIPERLVLDAELASERRSRIEAGGEVYEALPAGLAVDWQAARRESGAGAGRLLDGASAVLLFSGDGSRRFTGRIGSRTRGLEAPSALPVRLVGPGELRLPPPRGGALDMASQAGLALGAAALLGKCDSEALVRSGDGALWASLGSRSSLYIAARPDYVFRGEFHSSRP